MFLNGSPGQNIWVHKILPRYAENSVSEVDPRFEKKKKRKFGLSQPIKSTLRNDLTMVKPSEAKLHIQKLQNQKQNLN